MCCRGCWSNPSTKDAYRLSWASLIITFLAAWGGFALYGVSEFADSLVFLFVPWIYFASLETDSPYWMNLFWCSLVVSFSFYPEHRILLVSRVRNRKSWGLPIVGRGAMAILCSNNAQRCYGTETAASRTACGRDH